MNTRFFILELLKENPGGQVFLGADSQSRKKVIIKQVFPHAHQAWQSQFLMECKVLQALDHPGFPRLIEVHKDPLETWLAEEYIEGENLNSWMKSRPPRKERCRIFLEVLELIGQVHQAGFLYLDLKPDNILVRNGHACLIDFNSALPIGSIRPILVSRSSLPPEGIEGQPMNEKADQIGLGRLYLSLFGPSSIAWTALARNPESRFRDLETFARQVRKKNGQNPVLGWMAAILAACIGIFAFFVLVPVWNNAAKKPQTAEKRGSPDLDAAVLCQALEKERQAGTIVLDQSEWLIAARAAFEQNHLPLAGFLHDNKPDQDGFQSEFYDFLLALILGSDLPADRLEWLLDHLPEQLGWIEQLEMLCSGLLSRRLVLEAGPLQYLFDQAAGQLPLEEKTCKALMNYLLFCFSQREIHIELPGQLADEFSCKAPDLYQLYQAAQPR